MSLSIFKSGDGLLLVLHGGRSNGPIAQLAEHRADNAGVTGSIPVGPTITFNLFFIIFV